MNVMQCVFTGPPRVGKSSFWKRMIGKMPDKLMLSTGITDGSVRLDIRGSCGFAVHVSKRGWRELQVEEEVEGFVALVSQQGYMLPQELLNTPGSVQEANAATNEAQLSDTTASDSLPVQTIENADSVPLETVKYADSVSVEPVKIKDRGGNVSEKTDVQEHHHNNFNLKDDNNKELQNLPLHGSFNEAKEITVDSLDTQQFSPSVVLEKALINMKQAEVVSKIDSASYVYFTDTGGQPEFQELLSLVMAGCNTVLIVFNLDHDLDSSPPLECQLHIDKPPIRYDSPYAVGEMLCQSLMSVPIMEHSNVEGEDNVEESQGISRVFFVGTHKDLVSPERIKEMNRMLINLIRETPQYQAHIVQHSKGDNVIFAVDNFSQDNDDFLPVREATQSLIYGNNCFKVKAPTSWLFTGIVLKKVSKMQPIVSYNQCKEIARQCGIQSDDFDKAIKFLHYKIGVIRYYNTEGLKGVVVLKPQLIINVLSQLMKEAFSKPVTARAIIDDETIAKGLDNETITKGLEASRFMQNDFVLQLAKDLLLLAPHPESTVEHPKYYLTCMLPVEKASPDDQDDTAILFTRKDFSFPMGLCRAVITAILQNRMQTTTHWKINYQKLFRNSLEFTYASNVTFKLKCTKRHLSLSIMTGTNTISICPEVQKTIELIMIEAMKICNYGRSGVPIVGFICPDSDMTTPHYCTLTETGELQCLSTKKNIEIPDKLQQWMVS